MSNRICMMNYFKFTYMNIKKSKLIFSVIFITEMGFIMLFLILGDKCGSACDPHSILNPFGKENVDKLLYSCPAVCKYTPHPLFYIFADLFIATAVIYLIYFIIRKLQKK